MNDYLIAPEDCVIVKAFKTASTVREAARTLRCDPGGLLRKIHRIAGNHGFLEKVKGHWQLTARGMAVVAWVESSIQSQKLMLLAKPAIRISSTTWFSEQVILPHLQKLKGYFKNSPDFLITVPERGFEKEMISGGTDFVVVCHPPDDPAIAHKKILKEDYCLIVPRSWIKETKNKSEAALIDFLESRAYVRHHFLNPEVYLTAFNGRKLNHEITVDHMIGVRSAVANGLGWSCVPRLLVKEALKLKQISELKIKISSEESVCLWWKRENTESKKLIDTLTLWAKDACSAD